MALEMIEGLLAVVALGKGLAGGASGISLMRQVWVEWHCGHSISGQTGSSDQAQGGDPVFFQFCFPFFRHPVGGPWR